MEDDFIIAGAGIAGLAAALALARTGKRVRVLEEAADITEMGAGLQLGPNASGVLRTLGIDDEIDVLAGFPEEIRILDGLTGRQLNRVSLDEGFRRRFGAPYRVVHRGDLLGVLHRACERQSAISIETGAPVTGYDERDGLVSVESGAGTRTAGALVGADGIRSAVRARLLNDGPPDMVGHSIARALVPASDMPLKDNAVCLWLLPGGHIVHYPVRRGEVHNLVVAWDDHREDDGWGTPIEASEIASVSGNTVGPLRSVVEAAPSWRRWAAADRKPVGKWGHGPVTLLGDAAHPVLPYLAQGAAMALEDAVVLADCVKRHGELPQALRAYESVRRPRLAKMHGVCRRAGLAYHAGGGFRLVRNLVLRTMNESASRNRVAWIYDWRLPDHNNVR